MAGWLEKEVYSVKESSVEELQSCRCPHCRKILTTPYLYYFDEFPFCPSCGKRVSDKPAAMTDAELDRIIELKTVDALVQAAYKAGREGRPLMVALNEEVTT